MNNKERLYHTASIFLKSRLTAHIVLPAGEFFRPINVILDVRKLSTLSTVVKAPKCVVLIPELRYDFKFRYDASQADHALDTLVGVESPPSSEPNHIYNLQSFVVSLLFVILGDVNMRQATLLAILLLHIHSAQPG